MWNYYKTVVVNSAEPEPGIRMFAKNAKIFDPIKREMVDAVNVWRNGQYDPTKIEVIHKTAGYSGQKQVITLTCSQLEAGEYLLSFKVEMDGKFLSDYASPAYQGFYKPIVVNFVVPEGSTAAQIAELVADRIKLALPENNQFIKVTYTSGAVITITATDEYMFVKPDAVILQKNELPACGDTCLGNYVDVEGITVNETTSAKQPFATGTWILENLRLPNTLNYRYFGSNDEMPIAGLTYTQYTFDYRSERPGLGGHSGVGQGIEAITTHTFYVAPEAISDFEAAFGADKIKETYLSGGEIEDVDNDGFRDETGDETDE